MFLGFRVIKRTDESRILCHLEIGRLRYINYLVFNLLVFKLGGEEKEILKYGFSSTTKNDVKNIPNEFLSTFK